RSILLPDVFLALAVGLNVGIALRAILLFQALLALVVRLALLTVGLNVRVAPRFILLPYIFLALAVRLNVRVALPPFLLFHVFLVLLAPPALPAFRLTVRLPPRFILLPDLFLALAVRPIRLVALRAVLLFQVLLALVVVATLRAVLLPESFLLLIISA